MSFNIGNILIGVIGIGIGVWMLINAYNINHHIYFLDFVERKWGPGSGTMAYRYIGIILCIFSIFVMVGIIDISNSNNGLRNNQNTKLQNNQNVLPNTKSINIAP